MISEEALREHDQFVSTLSPPDVKLHTYRCDLCKEEAWHRAALQAFENGFPEFTEGTTGQQGYANVLRMKLFAKHGNLVLSLVNSHTEPKWWLDNRQTLASGTMKSSLGELVRKADLFLESPIKAQIAELEENLVSLKKTNKRELKAMDLRRREMEMREAELEAIINELQEGEQDG